MVVTYTAVVPMFTFSLRWFSAECMCSLIIYPVFQHIQGSWPSGSTAQHGPSLHSWQGTVVLARISFEMLAAPGACLLSVGQEFSGGLCLVNSGDCTPWVNQLYWIGTRTIS